MPEDSHLPSRDRVRRRLLDGLTVTEIAHELGISKATVCFHKRRLGYAMDGRFAQRYDWAAIQTYYDDGHSARETREHFGCSAWSWNAAVQRGALTIRPRAMPIERFLIADRPTDRGYLKRRLIAAGLKTPFCEECGLAEWRGQPLALQLHHVNGKGDDNRLENLALLCPNCHAQTDTWGGRNARRNAA
jgi:hypothetical protein